MSNPTDSSHADPCQAFAKRNNTMKSMKRKFSKNTQRMLKESERGAIPDCDRAWHHSGISTPLGVTCL